MFEGCNLLAQSTEAHKFVLTTESCSFDTLKINTT